MSEIEKFTRILLGMSCLLGTVLVSSCGPSAGDPREQKIYNFKWSPDGKKLAFTYQNNTTSNYDFHLYTINTDGTQLRELLDVNSKNHIFSLYQWAPHDNVLTGDHWNLFEVTEKGETQKILEFSSNPSDSNPDNHIKSTCSFLNSRYLIIQTYQATLWANLSNRQSVIKRSLEFIQPSSIEIKSTSETICSSKNNHVYLNASYYDFSSRQPKNQFLIGEFIPEDGKINNIVSFDPLKNAPPSKSLRVLGWEKDNVLIYAFASLTDITSDYVFEYNTTTQETMQRKDITNIGEFSPDFQKVAFLDFDVQENAQYLAISNVNGTDKRRLVKVKSLPKGNLPL